MKHFFIKIQTNISVQEKKWQRIYDMFNTETKPKKLPEIVSLWPPSSPDCNPFDYAILGVLENKTNGTSHPNIGLIKTAIEKEWNKMSPLWPGVVAPDRVLSMGQTELNCLLMLTWIAWNRTVFDIETVLTLNWIVWNRIILTFNCV